jgi:hypothetical protein
LFSFPNDLSDVNDSDDEAELTLLKLSNDSLSSVILIFGTIDFLEVRFRMANSGAGELST